ncbi:MAG: SDR family oxidoreductase [Planctomycetaceae bacterium]|nr:SDR family oxidoreductase [Planctomycetaceae bacterium]
MGRIEDLYRLDGQVAVVSGGGGQIGAKLCEILAEAGADIVMVDNNAELAASESKRIAAATQRQVVPKAVDITSEDAVKQLAAEVYDQFGRCDILINAAHYKGGAFFAPLDQYPLDAWKRVLEVNLTGAFLTCREIGGRMYKGNGGVIVNFSSTYGLVSPDPRIYGESGINSPIAYAATKSGLINMTRYIAIHWRPKVRANVLAPGGVEAGQAPEFIHHYVDRTPLGRMAKRDDYQGAILFMCSKASDYMTGAVVTVDGGWTAW